MGKRQGGRKRKGENAKKRRKKQRKKPFKKAGYAGVANEKKYNKPKLRRGDNTLLFILLIYRIL